MSSRYFVFQIRQKSHNSILRTRVNTLLLKINVIPGRYIVGGSETGSVGRDSVFINAVGWFQAVYFDQEKDIYSQNKQTNKQTPWP